MMVYQHFFYMKVSNYFYGNDTSSLIPIIITVLDDYLSWFKKYESVLVQSLCNIVASAIEDIDNTSNETTQFRLFEKSATKEHQLLVVGNKVRNTIFRRVLSSHKTSSSQGNEKQCTDGIHSFRVEMTAPFQLHMYIFPYECVYDVEKQQYKALPIEV